MSESITFREAPIRFIGRIFLVILRLLFGLFFLLAGINKIEWLGTDYLKRVFEQRLTELNPDSFASIYLENFGIPMYQLIDLVLVFGELAVGIGLLLGLYTKIAIWGGFFILFNLAIGGYYDASLLPFFILLALFLRYPTELWFGIDRWLARRKSS